MIYGTGLAAGYEIIRMLTLCSYLLSGGNKRLEAIVETLDFLPTFMIAHRELIKTINPKAELEDLEGIHTPDLGKGSWAQTAVEDLQKKESILVKEEQKV